MNRREFLRKVSSAGAATVLGAACGVPGAEGRTPPAGREHLGRRKLVIVVFGGGTRSSESMDDPKHRFIPRLWNSLVPRGTLFTNMRVDHRVVHPNSVGSIMTGHWEWDDLDWSKPVAHPTVFELYRKARRTADTSAWAFVYASILANTGESAGGGYGRHYAANVVEPPTIPRSTATRMDTVLRRAAARGSPEAEARAARECARLARVQSRIARGGLRSPAARVFLDQHYTKWKRSAETTSHDAFLTSGAISCMKTFAPDVMAIDYGEIDCAHYGSWSRYVEAIRRTDELTWQVWQATEELPDYRGNTMMLILPDHGRELDAEGAWGFPDHGDFYTNRDADEGCRRVWMLALGPGIREGKKIDTPVPITTAAATGLEFLGLDPSRGAAHSVMADIT